MQNNEIAMPLDADIKLRLPALGGMGYDVFACFGCEETKKEIIKYLGRQ